MSRRRSHELQLGLGETTNGLRWGLVELDGEGEVAGGEVVMRYGENALATSEGYIRRLAEKDIPASWYVF